MSAEINEGEPKLLSPLEIAQIAERYIEASQAVSAISNSSSDQKRNEAISLALLSAPDVGKLMIDSHLLRNAFQQALEYVGDKIREEGISDETLAALSTLHGILVYETNYRPSK